MLKIKRPDQANDPIRHGDIVVITRQGEDYGLIGIADVDPRRQTIQVNAGGWVINCDPKDPNDVRHLTIDDRVQM